jgi:predicted nucleotidyltransferase
MIAIDESFFEQVIDRVVDALAPERVYLFGSRAYGSPRSDSDLDLLLVMPPSEKRATEIRRLARQAIGEVGCGVDVVVRWTTDFDRRASWPSSLEATVRSKGRLLYGG